MEWGIIQSVETQTHNRSLATPSEVRLCSCAPQRSSGLRLQSDDSQDKWDGEMLVHCSGAHETCPMMGIRTGFCHSFTQPMALTLWPRSMKRQSISYPDSSAVAGETPANRDCSAPVCPAVVTAVTMVIPFHTNPPTLWIKQLNLSVSAQMSRLIFSEVFLWANCDQGRFRTASIPEHNLLFISSWNSE